MAISEKKKDELYKAVSNRIMDARIEAARLTNSLEVGKKIEDVLYHLSIEAPQQALDVFKPKSKNVKP